MNQTRADRLYDLKAKELDERAMALQKAEEECQRAVRHAADDYNNALVSYIVILLLLPPHLFPLLCLINVCLHTAGYATDPIAQQSLFPQINIHTVEQPQPRSSFFRLQSISVLITPSPHIIYPLRAPLHHWSLSQVESWRSSTMLSSNMYSGLPHLLFHSTVPCNNSSEIVSGDVSMPQ